MAAEKHIYNEMWDTFSKAVTSNHCQIDRLINEPSDTRRGITVLSYLHQNSVLVSEITNFQNHLKSLEPNQYYQPKTDLHLTVLSIITCVDNFSLSKNGALAYAEVFNDALSNVGSFEIHFNGVTASPNCILLQGFMPNELLSDLREKLRVAFKLSPLHTSIDSRYKIATAHSTVVRFNTPLNDPCKLFEILCQYRDYDFGTQTIDKLKLVFNNWYLQKDYTKILAESFLSPSVSR